MKEEKWYLIYAAEKCYQGKEGTYAWILDKYSSAAKAEEDAIDLSYFVMDNSTDVGNLMLDAAREAIEDKILSGDVDVPMPTNRDDVLDLISDNTFCEECLNTVRKRNLLYQVFEISPEMVKNLESNYSAMESLCAKDPLGFADKYCFEV